MGVPGFFGWVKRSYPRCVRAYVEGSVKQQNASSGSDSEHEVVEENQEDLDANPNHIEFDNFYLDMNGLIHACSHGDMYQNQPQNEEEIMIRIGVALNRLMNAVRPRNLVYLAIDGVAPRAKMNQQRSRRFISAKRQQLSKAHQMDASSSPNKYEFDSNAVTPGTQFMTNVGKYLRRFIHEELVNNPRWSNLKVFISDASVPGEGEHKIMDFIRKQRMQPGFDPNMTHILYGQDADLIFLGLGTHEVGFYILRDSMAVICKQCRRAGHNESTCFMYAPREDKPVAPGEPAEFVPLELVELPLLRQYLFRQFQIGREHMDLESIIDDFIMLCIFLGNDFLPSLPTLRISEDGLDLIIKLYRLLFINKHTPLYNKGKIRWDHLYWFLDEIAKYESKILRIRYSRKNKPNKEETKFVAPSDPNKIDIDPELSNENSVPDSELANEILVEIQSELVDGTEEEEDGTADLNGEIALLGSQIETDKISENLLHKILSGDLFEDIMVKRQIECSLLSEIGYPDDKWRENYHKLKFGSGSVEQVGLEYLVGVHWVMEYYLKGCPAWGWYYPHHYSAFAQDLVECLDVRQVALIELKWGQYLQADTGPFEPFQQLLAVLPLQSSKLLPQCYSDLMRSPNFESWYPIHFAIDIEQKREGIALLPFIDASVLQAGVAGQKESLTQEDVIRNASREAAVFFPCTIKEIFDDVIKLYTEAVPEIALDQDRHFLTGTVKRIEGIIFDTEAIVIATLYQNPSPPDQWIYKPNLLRGAKFSPKDITKEDLVKKKKELPRPGIGATLYMQPEYAIASFWPKIESTNVGYQMLAKLGWKGGPLGKNQEGISEPIQATRQEDQEMCSLMDVVDLELSDQRRVTSLKLNGKRSQRELNLYNKISSSFALKLTDNMGNYCALNNLPELVISCEGLTNQQRAFVHTLCRKKRSGKPTYSSYSSGPKHDRTLHVTCKVSTDVAAVLSRNLRELTPEQLALATELDGQKVVEYELGRLAENSLASAVDQNSASSRKKNESKSMDFSFAYSDEPVKQSRFNSSRSFHTQKSEVCRMFSRGHCIRGDRCKFLHVTEPARPGRRPNTHTDNDNNNNTEETRHHGATFAVAEGIETVPPRVSRMQMREDQRAKERNEERYKLSDKLQTDWRSKKEDRTPYDSAEPREYRERRQPYDSPEPREYRERRQPFRQESAQQRYEPMVDQESAVVKEERQSQRPERTEYRERRQPFRQESVQQRYEPQRNTVDPVIKDTPMEAQETPIIAKEAPMDKEERQPRSERREYRERKQPYDSAEPREYRERKQPYDSPEPREYRERRQPFRQESAQQRYEPQRNTFQPKMVPEIKDTPMVVQETPIVPKETPVVTKETPVAIKETSVVKEERLPQRTEPNEAAPVQMDIVAQPPTTKPRESRERPRREQQMKGNDNVTVSVNLDPRGPRPKKEPFKKDSQPVHNSSRPDYRPDQPKQHLALKLVGINKSTRKSAIESELHKWEIPFSELFLIRSDVGILKFANEDDLRHAMEHAHTPLDQFGIQFEIDTNDRSTKPDRREKPKHGGKSDRKEYAPKKSSSGMTQEMQSLEITDTRASPSPGLNEVEPEVKQPPAMQLTSNEVQQPVQNTNNTSSLKKMKPSSASFKPYGHANHNDPQPQDSVGYVMNLQQSLSPQDAMYYTQQQYYQQQYLAQQYQQQQYYQQQYQDPQYTQQGSNQQMYRMYPPGSQM